MSEWDKTVVINLNNTSSAETCPVCRTILEPDTQRSHTLRCPSCNYIKTQKTTIAPGQIVGNKYRMLSLLNCGGYGDLYLCHPLSDAATRYVLKVLRTSSHTSKRRFRREAMLLSTIQDNERIARIIDFWEAGEETFIIMEYIRGQNLRQISQSFKMDEHAVLQIAKETVHALKDIWEQYAIIHRDIKPENIMLDEKFHLKLLDFGLSKQCEGEIESAITMEQSSLGTPGFMSPEQFLDFKNADFRTDIFSLGATLFFLLTKTQPFNGATLMDVYKDTKKNSPPPAKNFLSKCSPGCIKLIRKMMEFSPDKRHSSYGELLQEIKELLH